MSCALRQLSSPERAASLEGLTWRNSELVPDPVFFACCGGKGIVVPGEGSARDATASICGLQRRFDAVVALERQFRRTWEPDGFRLDTLLAGAKGLSPADVRDLHHVLVTRVKRGAAVLADGDAAASVPSGWIWQTAFAAAWRFGFDVEVLTLDKAGTSSAARSTLGHAAPAAIFVENARRLWETNVAESLERIIAYACNAAFPLWIEVSATKPPERTGASVRAQLAERVGRAKAKPPLAWLGPEAMSRLSAVARIGPGLGARERPKSTPRQPKPKEFLPWSH